MIVYTCAIITRIRKFHGSCGSRSLCVARRDQAARTQISETSGSESEPSRTKAEDQAFRFFGPRGKVLVEFRIFSHLASEFGIRQPFAHDLSHQETESFCILQRQAIVVAEGLLINVAEQV